MANWGYAGLNSRIFQNAAYKSCFYCGMPGHIARNCPRKTKATGPLKTNNGENNHLSSKIPLNQPKEAKSQNLIEHLDAYNLKVQLSGDAVQRKIESFKDANLHPALLENLERLGWKRPTPIQQNALPIIMDGKDLLACAQTGTGKTAAYLLPILNHILQNCNPNTTLLRAVVIVPTHELAIQIAAEAAQLTQGCKVRIGLAFGGFNIKLNTEELNKGCSLLIGTPGRLIHILTKDKTTRKELWKNPTVSLRDLNFLVLDDADRILDQGIREIELDKHMREMDLDERTRQNESTTENMGLPNYFLPQVQLLMDEWEDRGPKKPQRQSLMFSATFPTKLQTVAKHFLKKNYPHLAIGDVGAANRDVDQIVIQVSDKKAKLVEILRKDMASFETRKMGGENGKKTLVFVERKVDCDKLLKYLQHQGEVLALPGLINAMTIHSNFHQNSREEILYKFRNEKFPILIATAVAARGLDIDGIDHVINYDLPKEDNQEISRRIAEYVHKIGRTGRMGQRGRATSFFDPERDAAIVPHLIHTLVQAQKIVPEFLVARDAGLRQAGRISTTFAGEIEIIEPEW